MPQEQSNKIKIKASQIILFVLSIIAIYVFAPQLIDFKTTVTLLWNSNWLWLAAAVILMAFCFLAAAYVQFAAGYYIGSVRIFCSYSWQDRC